MYIKIENENHIECLTALADKIWRECFGSLFEPKALDQVIKQVQSKDAILKQIAEGYVYHFIQVENISVGYFAYKIDFQKDELFLSKIYIVLEKRDAGLGRQVLRYLEDLGKDQNISKITLTVLDKNTASIKAYEKWGFQKTGVIERDFGKDIKCVDYIMTKVL